MERVSRVDELRRLLDSWRSHGEAIALVPTMGNLHPGHLSLVELASRQADRVVVSIFVNPAQFGPNEDFARYPRTREQDLRALDETACHAVFAPEQTEMYPRGPEGAVRIVVPGLSDVLEGAHRPGHFEGVATVVLRLFNAVQPEIAVFGSKDYQQLHLIRYLTRDLLLPIDIVAGPTVRESDGLALSSRNQYLSAEERRRAPALHRALRESAHALKSRARDFGAIEKSGLQALRRAGFTPDYLVVRRADLGAPGTEDANFVVLAAARLGNTRLIDNIQLRGGVA